MLMLCDDSLTEVVTHIDVGDRWRMRSTCKRIGAMVPFNRRELAHGLARGLACVPSHYLPSGKICLAMNESRDDQLPFILRVHPEGACRGGILALRKALRPFVEPLPASISFLEAPDPLTTGLGCVDMKHVPNAILNVRKAILRRMKRPLPDDTISFNQKIAADALAWLSANAQPPIPPPYPLSRFVRSESATKPKRKRAC